MIPEPVLADVVQLLVPICLDVCPDVHILAVQLFAFESADLEAGIHKLFRISQEIDSLVNFVRAVGTLLFSGFGAQVFLYLVNVVNLSSSGITDL